MDLNIFCSDVSQVPLCIVFQVIWDTKPVQTGGEKNPKHEYWYNYAPKSMLEGERKQVITRGTFSCQEDSFHIWVQQWFYPFQHQPRLQSSRLLGLHLVRMSHVAIQRDMIERNRSKILQYILETIVIVIWPENERIGFLSDNIEFGKRPNLRSIRDSLKL